MIGDPHVSRVRFLYKTILRLHRGLPEDLRLLGTSYLKDEFKRHKNVDVVAASRFIAGWTVSKCRKKCNCDQSRELGPAILL